MIHQDEEHPHRNWMDVVTSPRKERQKWMTMRIPLAPRGKDEGEGRNMVGFNYQLELRTLDN